MPGGEYSPRAGTSSRTCKAGFGSFYIPPACCTPRPCTATPSFFKPHSALYTCRRALPLYPHSLIVPSAIPVGEIFPCKGTAVVRSSSTAVLTGSWICTAAFPNQRCSFSPPSGVACRVRYSMKSLTISLPFRPFPAV